MPDIKNVIFRGPVLCCAGYGVHARQIARGLLKRQEEKGDINLTFDVVPWGMTPWLVDHKAQNGLVGKIIQNSEKKPDAVYDLSLQLQLPNEWEPFLAKTNVGITAAVETDRCNPAWIDSVNRMDRVIVPSEHIKSTLKNSGDIKTKIEVIPESWFEACRFSGLSTTPERKSSLEESLKLDTSFNFLLVSQFTGNNPENDRKNIAYTLKWMLEEFKDNQDVGLIIKTNFGRHTSTDKQNCLKVLSEILLNCRKGIGPRIYLLHGSMTDEELVGVYTDSRVKALVNLTRGEGFGLPILEAAACGLPVIATDWSAHAEFLRQGKYVKVDYNLIQIHESRVDNSIFMKEAKWASPIEADAKKKLRRFYESPAVPTEWAKELQAKLLVTHSPEAIEKQYDAVLNELLS
jgi:glycosyltransferase involved in cell wall biosynthesis